MCAETGEANRQRSGFLLLYALAVAGGSIAYVPLLTLLLPGRIAELAGSDGISWIAYLAFAGAICASVANIAFGWASDLSWRPARIHLGWSAAVDRTAGVAFPMP